MKPVAIRLNNDDVVGFHCAQDIIGLALTENVLSGHGTDDDPTPIYNNEANELGEFCECCGCLLYLCNY